jgi:3-deoxy-D-manno-octulosonic-acid transferase
MTVAAPLYRATTLAAGAILVPGGCFFLPRGSVWRARLGDPAGLDRVAGGPWIHAASLGEAQAALSWAGALMEAGYRAPFLLTTRTRAGLARVDQESGGRAVSAMAPLDFPQAVRRLLRAAAPTRLDLIETELWPNLLLEAARAGVPAVAVSASVSPRSEARLRALGFAGSRYFGGLHVLAQSEAHAARFRSLGVAASRCAVIGDVKADGLAPPVARGAAGATAATGVQPPPAASRDVILFASWRPGEEEAALSVAARLSARSDAGRHRFVLAPRHDEGVRALAAALERRRTPFAVRKESDRAATPLRAWVEGLSGPGERRVGILATRGELSGLYPRAGLTIVGGTFAPFGGHNVLEPAAEGSPVIVGPHHDDVAAHVALLVARGAAAVASGAEAAAEVVSAWLDEPLSARGDAAREVVREAAGAARRGVRQLEAWRLAP